jgi:hypothetical protein
MKKFVCKDCFSGGESLSLGALLPKNCDVCNKLVDPKKDEYYFVRAEWIKNLTGDLNK